VGADAGGEANLGVVLTFSPTESAGALAVVAAPVALEEECEDEPHPLASRPAAQAADIARAMRIGNSTLT
jgi:hypothetical protein